MSQVESGKPLSAAVNSIISAAVLPASFNYLSVRPRVQSKQLADRYDSGEARKKRSIHFDHIVGCANELLRGKFCRTPLPSYRDNGNAVVKQKNRSVRVYSDDDDNANALVLMADELRAECVDLNFLTSLQTNVDRESEEDTDDSVFTENAVDYVDLTSFSAANTSAEDMSARKLNWRNKTAAESTKALLRPFSATNTAVDAVMWPFAASQHLAARSVSSRLRLSSLRPVKINDEASSVIFAKEKRINSLDSARRSQMIIYSPISNYYDCYSAILNERQQQKQNRKSNEVKRAN